MTSPESDPAYFEIPELSLPREIVSEIGAIATLAGGLATSAGVLVKLFEVKVDLSVIPALQEAVEALSNGLLAGGFATIVGGAAGLVGSRTYKNKYVDEAGVEHKQLVFGRHRQAQFEEEA